MELQEAKSWVLSELSDAEDDGGWTDAVLEQALRQALTKFSSSAAARESSFTILATSFEQDLSSLGALRILEIAYPWQDGIRFEDYRVADWRVVDESTVRFDRFEVVLGEDLRVRYLANHTLDGLDGAIETTLWATEYPQLIHLACHYCCELRFTELVRLGGEPPKLDYWRRLSDFYMSAYASEVSGGGGLIYWGRLGL